MKDNNMPWRKGNTYNRVLGAQSCASWGSPGIGFLGCMYHADVPQLRTMGDVWIVQWIESAVLGTPPPPDTADPTPRAMSVYSVSYTYFLLPCTGKEQLSWAMIFFYVPLISSSVCNLSRDLIFNVAGLDPLLVYRHSGHLYMCWMSAPMRAK